MDLAGPAAYSGPLEGFVMAGFKREDRYLIMKFKDVRKYLTDTEKEILIALTKKITKGRCDDEKDQLDCVVVESDWPEYEPTWRAIEERMAEEAEKEWDSLACCWRKKKQGGKGPAIAPVSAIA